MESNEISNKVVSLQEIEEIAKGEAVKIPGWKKGTTIVVRLRPIDITPALLKMKSKIPNPLKKEAQEVFESKTQELQKIGESALNNPEVMEELTIVARLALVEPTYDEIEKRLPLLTEQKIAIFDWTLRGVQELVSFRSESKQDDRIGTDGEKLRDKAK